MNLSLKIYVKSNDEIWHIENILKSAGYIQTDGCYWVEIFKNKELNNTFTIVRDDD